MIGLVSSFGACAGWAGVVCAAVAAFSQVKFLEDLVDLAAFGPSAAMLGPALSLSRLLGVDWTTVHVIPFPVAVHDDLVCRVAVLAERGRRLVGSPLGCDTTWGRGVVPVRKRSELARMHELCRLKNGFETWLTLEH